MLRDVANKGIDCGVGAAAMAVSSFSNLHDLVAQLVFWGGAILFFARAVHLGAEFFNWFKAKLP